MKSDPVDESLARGVDFLRRRQEPTGEFAIELWREDEGPGSRVDDHVVMVTALRALRAALRRRGHARRRRVRAVRFLIGEMRPPGVWSYWTAASGKRIEPDLDDTALLSFVLRRYHPHLALGSNVETMLALANRRWSLPHLVQAAGSAQRRGRCRQRERRASRSGSARRREPLATTFAPACCPARRRARTGTTSTTPPFTTRSPGRSGTGSASLGESSGRARRQGPGPAASGRVVRGRALHRLDPVDASERGRVTIATRSPTRSVRCSRDSGRTAGGRASPHSPVQSRPAPRTFRWGSEELTAAACVEALARVRAHPATGTVESQRGLM